ncbi:hypothetical protein [Ideonella oryzae]|uniref:Uncharacterized protein n=1 Tax=Ideonella oryzae TaxID=2937441 RepID=A0ABT1BR53_9BURK|nr:hypothetical protein [Ideonella oryzae]MCO5977862.1 hypothetical protein [Ideonella oryzae]
MNTREVIALAAAPLGSGLLQGALMGNMGALIFGLIASYLFAAAVGLPALIIARRRGWTTFGKTLLVGTCAGLAAGLLLLALTETSGFSAMSVLAGVVLLGTHGLVVSLFYWLIAYWRAKKHESFSH